MRPLALALCLLAACTSGSGFDLAPLNTSQSRFPIGSKCDTADECASNVCADKVCCRKSCDRFASCAVAGHEGDCTPRAIGAACSDTAPCAPATDGSAVPCVDGVCCATSCGGLCQSCAVPGHEGTCRDALDNTDARGQCGNCWACFSGTCAPAIVGTDPKAQCAAESASRGIALACGARQLCAPALGSTCTTTAECAQGECIGDHCLIAEAEVVDVFPMHGSTNDRFLGAGTVDSSGALSLLFTESEHFTDPSSGDIWILDHTLGVATRSPAGAWSGRRVFSDYYDYGSIPSAIASLGRWLYVASYGAAVSVNSGTDCQTPPPPPAGGVDPTAVPCGIFGQLIGPDGQASALETITARGFTGTESALLWIGMLALPSGDLALGYATSDAIFLKLRSAATGTWGAEIPVARPLQDQGYFDRFQLVPMGGGGAFVYREDWYTSADAPHLGATPFDGAGKVGSRSSLGPIPGMTPAHCEARGINAARVAAPSDEALLAVFQCACNYPTSAECRHSALAFLATWRPATGWSEPQLAPEALRLSDFGPLSVPFPSNEGPWLLGGNWPTLYDIGLSWSKLTDIGPAYYSAGSQALLPGVTLEDLVALRGADGSPILAGIPFRQDTTLPPLKPELTVYRYHP